MTPLPPQDDATRKSSFQELVEPEIEVLLRVGRTITSNQHDTEELVQETLLRAYRAIDGFDGRHPRAARPAFGRAELPSAEDTFVAHELHADLDAAIRALDPRFRAALMLVDVHDLSYSEAAAVIGVPVGTVMSRLSRARDRVRKALQFSPLTKGGLS